MRPSIFTKKYFTFKIARNNHIIFCLSLFITGEEGNGDDYLSVGIQDGYLWFQFDVGSGK